MGRSYDSIAFFQNRVISRKPGVSNFLDIIKIAIILIKAISKNSIKVKRIRKKY